jgi:hypothetical protein
MDLARAHDLDVEALEQELEASPMATVTARACSRPQVSACSEPEVTKMLSQDWSAQAGQLDQGLSPFPSPDLPTGSS